MSDIKYVITVDSTGAQKAVETFDQALGKLDDQSQKTEKAHSGLWKQVALGELAYKAAEKAGRFMWDFLKDSATASMEAEKANKALAASLEITGRPVESLTRHFSDYANELQQATIYDDEAIKRSQALMIQLTSLDKNGLDRATKGAIGLASVMGMDLESAASLVAKAMSGNTAMLSRYGIQVDQTLSKEEQRVQVLDKLNQFYGRATADTETYGGKLAQLKNKYGDIQEAVGGYITKNLALMNALNGLAEAALFFMTIGDKLEQQEKDLTEVENQRIDIIGKALRAGGMEQEEVQKTLELRYKDILSLQSAIRQGMYGVAAKDALTKASREHTEQVKKETAEQDKLSKGTNTFTGAVEKLNKKLETHLDMLGIMPGEHNKNTKAIKDQVPAVELLALEFEKLAIDSHDAQVDISRDMNEWTNKAIDAAMKVADVFSTVYGFMSDYAMQTYTNMQIGLDNYYKKEAEKIEKSKMNEEEKYNAMAALDAEYETKSATIKRQQAEQQKSTSIANAYISTFEAAARTYSMFGWPLGILPALIVTGLGLALVSKIKAQAIPLATGGIFKESTLLASPRGNQYQVAEAGEPEVVAPLSGLRKELGIGGGGSIIIQNRIFLDGREMKQWISKVVEDRSRVGKLKIASKAVA